MTKYNNNYDNINADNDNSDDDNRVLQSWIAFQSSILQPKQASPLLGEMKADFKAQHIASQSSNMS